MTGLVKLKTKNPDGKESKNREQSFEPSLAEKVLRKSRNWELADKDWQYKDGKLSKAGASKSSNS